MRTSSTTRVGENGEWARRVLAVGGTPASPTGDEADRPMSVLVDTSAFLALLSEDGPPVGVGVPVLVDTSAPLAFLGRAPAVLPAGERHTASLVDRASFEMCRRNTDTLFAFDPDFAAEGTRVVP